MRYGSRELSEADRAEVEGIMQHEGFEKVLTAYVKAISLDPQHPDRPEVIGQYQNLVKPFFERPDVDAVAGSHALVVASRLPA